MGNLAEDREIKRVFVFGNGNISFQDFINLYVEPLKTVVGDKNTSFILCDFRGTDTLMAEFLKTVTEKVTVYHIGNSPRYKPDAYKTKVSGWAYRGGFISDEERDHQAIDDCTHFLAVDFNTNEKRKSGTAKNIERCLELNKESIL